MDKPTWGALLKRLREDRDFRIVQAAKRAGLPPSTLSRIESGDRMDPRMSTLWRLARAYGLALSDLVRYMESGVTPATAEERIEAALREIRAELWAIRRKR